ncbi:hypothetical protein ACHAQJ_004119 [Trichoderma viride]
MGDSFNNGSFPSFDHNGLSSGEIAAIVVGCTGGVLVIGLIAFAFYRKKIGRPLTTRRLRQRRLAGGGYAAHHPFPMTHHHNPDGTYGPYMPDSQGFGGIGTMGGDMGGGMGGGVGGGVGGGIGGGIGGGTMG